MLPIYSQNCNYILCILIKLKETHSIKNLQVLPVESNAGVYLAF